MKLFVKTAIATVALASMLQADVTLLGVDGGVTVLGLRLGGNAGLTVGKRPLKDSGSSTSSASTSCPTATVSCAATYVSPCSYVCEPCEVIEPPACPCK